ncbi:MAG: small, acid-soluble spore protein, alpha/beta type [Lachnospiraceae bacterium]
MAKRKKEFDYNKLTPQELMRFEIAQELGLDDKIVAGGWGALSAQESGRIGGIIASRNRKKRAAQAPKED